MLKRTPSAIFRWGSEKNALEREEGTCDKRRCTEIGVLKKDSSNSRAKRDCNGRPNQKEMKVIARNSRRK
jgi:hypothetical protein